MTTQRLFIIGIVLLAAGAWIFFGQDSSPQESVRFTDASHLLNHSTWSSYVDSMLASGVCVFDANEDGLDDIFIPGPGIASVKEPYMENPRLGNTLFLNRGLNEQGVPVFEDVSERAGVRNVGKLGVGCAAADYANNGTTDLVVTNATRGVLYSEYGLLSSPENDERLYPPPFFTSDGTDGKYEFPKEGGVTLFQNQGNDEEGIPRFEDVTIASGLTKGGNGSAAAWADVNNDGFLDLFVANFSDFDFAGFTSPYFGGQENVLYKNNGDGTFTDVTEIAGVRGEPEFVYTTEGEKQYAWRDDLFDSKGRVVGDPAGNTLAAAFFDFNQDGLADLVTMDDIPGRARLYQNLGEFRFREVSNEHGFGEAGAWMGVAIGDLTGNGRLDVFGSNLGGPSGSRFSRPETDITYTFDIFNPPNPATYYNGLWLFEDGRFSEKAKDVSVNWEGWEPDIPWFAPEEGLRPENTPRAPEGLEQGEFGFGAVIFDYDNDGNQDLFWTGELRRAGTLPQERRWQGNPGRLLKNEGDGTSFRDTAREANLLNLSDKTNRATYQNGRGVAVGDFNNDGYYDVVLTNAGGWDSLEAPPLLGLDEKYRAIAVAKEYRPGPTFLYLSEGGDNNWLAVRLEGKESNRSGIGARIEIQYREKGKVKQQVREVRAGESFASQNSLEQIFGLGGAALIERVTVFWPSGAVQTKENIAANQRLVIIENE